MRPTQNCSGVKGVKTAKTQILERLRRFIRRQDANEGNKLSSMYLPRAQQLETTISQLKGVGRERAGPSGNPCLPATTAEQSSLARALCGDTPRSNTRTAAHYQRYQNLIRSSIPGQAHRNVWHAAGPLSPTSSEGSALRTPPALRYIRY